MQYLGTLKVIPELPEEIRRLEDLAYNLYFSWNPEARQLFRVINPSLWTKLNHNPVKFLREAQQSELVRCSKDPIYLSSYRNVMEAFDRYMAAEGTWFATSFPKDKEKIIAYFSAEFGFHESLPIYSGGLGVLAGDHIKSASDLGLPMVGMSLFYHQTYFTQQIDAHSNQIALYIPHDPEELPLRQVLDAKGKPLTVVVPVGNRDVTLRVWIAQVGRVPAYLLDANVPENAPEARMLTARLYGGDQEMRISQEILLGMGGVLVLQKLGIEPMAWHMNEGHSVFLALERIRNLIKHQHLEYTEALEAVAANTIFTTHTPVPAGNDAFPLNLMDKFFQRYWESIGIRRYQFMELGSQVQPEGYEIFNLTILSLKLSKFRNGVSKLHGEVSRELWRDVWPTIPTDEIPITHITNGVHSFTWTVYKMRQLYDEHLGKDWVNHLDEKMLWQGVHGIPDQALWTTKREIKQKLLNHLRERFEAQVLRNKIGTLQRLRLKDMLKPDVLTIGFARRFATYKRGTLIFRDKERLKRILNDPNRPVQLLFAGKAHPKDLGGQELIRAINNISMEDGFRGKVFFVENYDMSLSRDLISGVDVWLNNPRRPQEASGTSGQKVALNGGINLSVLDGWWCEGYDGKNGFAFGDREDYSDLEELDSWDSDAIYDILENDLIPLYYKRGDDGIPHDWIKMMKNSMVSLSPVFNTFRMVKDYTNKMYLPAIKQGEEFAKNDFALARDFSGWRDKMNHLWSQITVQIDESIDPDHEIVLKYNEPLKLRAKVHLGEIDPSEVKVQVYLINEFDQITFAHTTTHELVEMSRKKGLDDNTHIYEATIKPSNSGHYRYTIRVLPYHKRLVNSTELGLVAWMKQKPQA
ncbi:MAG: alpha-glucan family phosphorylase [Calditrichae bacterium]|nr:alpha-glucan family phosphorylase [Calditrichota bacterium]MCB9087910.1 alpha-glucan family phosphorylase [Calditrichia bacterium]